MTALLLFGDTERSPALRHELPLAIGDPLLFVESGERRIVLTSHLERARIAAVAPEVEILEFFDLGYRELIAEGRSRSEAQLEIAVRAVKEAGVREATVPGTFPIGLADRLRAAGVALVIDEDAVDRRRRAKAGAELEGIRVAQRAAEAGMRAAAELLARATPGEDGDLHLGGEALTAERVRDAIRAATAAAGAPSPPDIMVCTVRDGFGHDPGSGPLPAGLPIEVDLWPRHEASGCFADMTRTFLVGEPEPAHAAQISEWEGLVRRALERARADARPGVTGRELYDGTCELFEAAGYRTQRTGPGEDPAEGFQFGLGHGVGLEVHEAPGLGLAGHDALLPGDVIAIEPGLWDRRIGGVRFEDLLLITEDGSETLTEFSYSLDPRG